MNGNHDHKAIFYDAGLTLIGPYLTIQEVSVLICDRFGLSADLQAVRYALSVAEERFVQVQREDRHVWASEEAIRRMWTEYYSMALRESGIVAAPELVRTCAEAIYDEYAKHEYWHVYEDAEAALIEGKRQGYIQGVISDWGKQLGGILQNLGLTEYLDFVVVSSVMGIAKPNPRIFECALTRAGVRPHEAVHVGDSYHTDVIGARVAGITPILLDRDGRHRNMDCLKIRRLDELFAHVGRKDVVGSLSPR